MLLIEGIYLIPFAADPSNVLYVIRAQLVQVLFWRGFGSQRRNSDLYIVLNKIATFIRKSN